MADMPLEVMTLSELAVKIEFSVNQVRLFSMGHLGRVAPLLATPEAGKRNVCNQDLVQAKNFRMSLERQGI